VLGVVVFRVVTPRYDVVAYQLLHNPEEYDVTFYRRENLVCRNVLRVVPYITVCNIHQQFDLNIS